MQKFRMLKHAKGVHDGQLHPVEFHKGETYEIGESLADQFIELGIVELADEEKSEGDSPANKMKKAAPENKAKKSDDEK